MEKEMIDRNAIIVGLTSHIIGKMSNDELFEYAHAQMTSYFEGLTDCDLLDEASNADYDTLEVPSDD
jgi:hypothetical protein